MALPRMRPSFVIDARCRPEDMMDALRDRLEDNSQRVDATFSQNQGVLQSRGNKKRFWSPCLDLTVEDMTRLRLAEVDGEGGSVTSSKIWGTFSPRPEIWTGFIFAIGTATVISVIALFFGVAQIMSREAPSAFAVPVVAMLFAAGLYASALVGQGLSLDEMYRIRNYVDTCLQAAEERARRRPPQRTDASSQL
jgi:hypothetical protein